VGEQGTVKFVIDAVHRSAQIQGIATTLTSNMLSYLLRIHASQIVATKALRPLLLSLRGHLRQALLRQRNQIGYNLAALKFIKRQEEEARTADFYERGEREQWAEDEIQVMKERIQSGENRKRKRISIKA
jgi:U3 small nucleolar RNA-associated protein 12